MVWIGNIFSIFGILILLNVFTDMFGNRMILEKHFGRKKAKNINILIGIIALAVSFVVEVVLPNI